MGGPSGSGEVPAGYKYLLGQLLEGKFALCLSSTRPGGGPAACKTLEGSKERGQPVLGSTASEEEFDYLLNKCCAVV